MLIMNLYNWQQKGEKSTLLYLNFKNKNFKSIFMEGTRRINETGQAMTW